MRVAIAGGHGKIALLLTRLLAERDVQVASLIRNLDHAADIRQAGGDPVPCDLESDPEEQIAEAIGQADAVVFAAGAGPGSGVERKWTVDHGGAVKMVAAARTNDIRRYVMISAIGADPGREGEDTFSIYLRAKGQADAELRDSGLDYTIVRPASLTEDPGAGLVQVAKQVGGGSISREDVAAVVAAVLHQPATAGQTFEIASGVVPVQEAVESVAGSA